MRILVAHQDARTRGRLRNVARGLRVSRVKVVTSPEEVLERLRDWHPDVVLMSAPMAERYGHRASPERGAAPPLRRDVTRLAPPDAAPRGSRWSGWDRDHAALELAGVVLAMEQDAAEPRPSRRSRPADPAPDPLTSMERQILAAVAAGSTPTQVAEDRGIPVGIIDGHIADVMAKLHRLDLHP